MPQWHLKNELCYNSRLTVREFEYVIADYARGITPQQSSDEFREKMNIKISRQTIASYFIGISRAITHERKSYPWWSIEWCEFEDKHFEIIRNIVYAKNNQINEIRKTFAIAIGHQKSADNHIYIKILREMSKAMNGIPKNSFPFHLVRACEIALPLYLKIDDPFQYTYSYIFELFYDKGHVVFSRKNSKTTERTYQDWKANREEMYDWNDSNTLSLARASLNNPFHPS